MVHLCCTIVLYECINNPHSVGLLVLYCHLSASIRLYRTVERQVFVLWLRYSKGIFGTEGTNEDQRITTSNVWYLRINLSMVMIIYVLPWSSTDYSLNDWSMHVHGSMIGWIIQLIWNIWRRLKYYKSCQDCTSGSFNPTITRVAHNLNNFRFAQLILNILSSYCVFPHIQLQTAPSAERSHFYAKSAESAATKWPRPMLYCGTNWKRCTDTVQY
jgi:hypothetical protein